MVAQLLTEWGYTVDRSLGGTGVVGTLSTETGTEGVEDGSDGSGKPHAIILRADMDALPIEEHNQFDHRCVRCNCSRKSRRATEVTSHTVQLRSQVTPCN